MRRVFLALALLLPLPGCAHAQAGVSDSVQVRNRCRLAIQVIETGHPQPHARWAYEYVRRCGNHGTAAVARAITAAATEGDRTTWELLSLPAFYVVDAGIFESALRVAQDRAATTTARAHSMMMLIYALSPGTLLSYDDLTRGHTVPAHRVCFGSGRLGPHFEVRVESPLSSDYRERLLASMTRLSQAAEEESAIRQAARCVVAHAELPRGG